MVMNTAGKGSDWSRVLSYSALLRISLYDTFFDLVRWLTPHEYPVLFSVLVAKRALELTVCITLSPLAIS